MIYLHLNPAFELQDFWYRWVFTPVYGLLIEDNPWLYGLLLSVLCACRLIALVSHRQAAANREIGADIACRTLWYGVLIVLAWNGPILVGYHEYSEQNPGSNLAWLLPPYWDLLWINPFLITLTMVGGMPRQPVGRRLVTGAEVLLSCIIAILVLITAIPQSVTWLVMMFNMIVEWSLKYPHIPPGEMRYGLAVPAAVRLAKQLSLTGILTCLAGIGLLFPFRHRGFAIATAGGVCLLISAGLIWHVDYSVIDSISPSFSSFTFTHSPLRWSLALAFVIPGIGWIGWWMATHMVEDHDVVCVESHPGSTVRLVETICSCILAFCVGLELCRHTHYATEGLGDSFGFFSWALAFLCCLRSVRWNTSWFRGARDQGVHRYCAGLSVARVILYSGLALIQLGILALGLYWYVGLQALWPAW